MYCSWSIFMEPKQSLLCYWIYIYIYFFCVLYNLLLRLILNAIDWKKIITKTLILLFILRHLYGVAVTRLADGCTPLHWPDFFLVYYELRWSWRSMKRPNAQDCCFCSYSILLIIVNLSHSMIIEWLNKTIQTTLCWWLTYKTRTIFSNGKLSIIIIHWTRYLFSDWP